MTMSNSSGRGRLFGDLTAPGRSSYDWSILLAAVALLLPVSGLVSIAFADRSRRRGYQRWKSALALGVWCTVLGISLRAMLHVGVIP